MTQDLPHFQRLLAATDLSAHARHAAERAAMISQSTGATLDLLHVANLAPLDQMRQLLGADAPDLSSQVLDTAHQQLGALVTLLHQRYGVQAGMRVASGSLLTELAHEAQAHPQGLLVCGARGESPVRSFLLGTTALRVLSTTTCPVLVVKQQPHTAYRRLLVPVDFSAGSLRAVQQARQLAPQAELVLFHAFEAPFESQLRYASVDEDTVQHYRTAAREDARQKLQALRLQADCPPERCSLVVQHGNPVLRIVQQEQELDCDLIVMGKHGQNALEELLLGSVTKHVLAECQSDILITV